jgi:hypothetical protein
VFLANCRVTVIAFSDEARSPILLTRKNVILNSITSIQPTDRRSRNIRDRIISVTRFPLVAKSYQTKAQAGHKAEELCSNPFQESSAPNYFPYD